MSNQPTFSLAYTSCRANSIANVVAIWRSRAANPHGVEVVIAVDEGDDAALAAAKSVPDAKVLIQDESPFNCVKGWNLAAAHTTGKVIIGVSDDFMPPERWDDDLLSLERGTWLDKPTVVHVNDGFVQEICTQAIITRARYDQFGYLYYPQYESMFCLDPDSRVYMRDYSFKKIVDIVPGDQVIGVERKHGKRGGGKQKRDFMCEAEVTAVHTRIADRVKVTLESGKELICTPDHRWAYYSGGRPSEYGIPKMGRKLVKMFDVPGPPPPGLEWELGWLAGMFDGEGCFPLITQSPIHNPAVSAKLEAVLRKVGFDFSTKEVRTRGHLQNHYTINGGRNSYLKFLNWLNPVKRVTKQSDKRMLSSRFGQKDPIVSVEPIGKGQVVCLTTTTGNFVAEGYLSHNCDTELTEVANRDGVMLEAMHLLFEHMHCDNGKRPRDQHDNAHSSQARWDFGEQLFNFRKSMGFPLDDGPLANGDSEVEVPREATKDDFAVYIQATKDDFCLFEVCKRLIDEGVTTFFFSIPDKYWSGKVTPQADIDEVMAVANALEGIGAKNVYKRMFNVDSYTAPGDNRIMVETKLRNDALKWIRSNGFQHILVVDGDELWSHGLVQNVLDVVNRSKPTSISCQMIPTIGLPGYPIANAHDRATIYIGGGETFRSCRGPYSQAYMLNGIYVVHFTATRKTMEEIIEKHRASGHYDDPEYDFEGWIANVLPNVTAGMRNVHMYTRYQVWPLVRNWRASELETMPDSIKPYLSDKVDPPGIIRFGKSTPVAEPRKKTNFEKFTGKRPGQF